MLSVLHMATISDELQSLFRGDWEFEMLDNPEFASQAGEHDLKFGGDPEDESNVLFHLQDVSPRGYARRAEHSKRMLLRIHEILQENEARRYRHKQLQELSPEEREKVLTESSFKDLWKADSEQPDLLSEAEEFQGRMFRSMHMDCEKMIETAKLYLLPINSIGVGGVTMSFIENIEMMRLSCPTDFELYLARLRAFHMQIDQFIEALQEGIKTGMVASKAICKDVESQLEQLISSDLDMLREPFMPPSETRQYELNVAEAQKNEEEQKQLYEEAQAKAKESLKKADERRAAAAEKQYQLTVSERENAEKRLSDCMNAHQAALDSKVTRELHAEILQAIDETKVGFAKVLTFYREEYSLHTREDPSCSSLPNGPEIYQQCLKYHTTTDLTAEEIHLLGLSEVAAIEKRYIEDVLKPLGFTGSFEEFVRKVQVDQRFFVESAERLKGLYEEKCKEVKRVIPRFFSRSPKSPLSIEHRTVGPAAYYLAGTADGLRPGKFYVNTRNVNEKPIYEITALTLHEAIPGHHHQVSLALESDDLPMFLRCCEDRRYEVCPARRNMYSSYIEGWALYCEHLGEEMGLYSDAYDIFGRLSMDMMRAVRCVVDTGLHAKGWSIEKSVVYMMEKTGMHRKEVESEIYRYATWPGQAVAYKVGQLEFLRLRRKAETAMQMSGSSSIFKISEFHDVCLDSGPVSLSLLEELIEKYIADKLEKLRVFMEEQDQSKKKSRGKQKVAM